MSVCLFDWVGFGCQDVYCMYVEGTMGFMMMLMFFVQVFYNNCMCLFSVFTLNEIELGFIAKT